MDQEITRKGQKNFTKPLFLSFNQGITVMKEICFLSKEFRKEPSKTEIPQSIRKTKGTQLAQTSTMQLLGRQIPPN